jgi:osmotically-inducible protein OsmY
VWGTLPSPGFGWTATAIPAGSRGAVPAPAFTTAEIPGAPTAGTVVAAVALRRGQPAGPTTDAEIEDFLYDVLDLIPGTAEVEVRCENGRATISGNVPHKRQKRDVGEIAWAIPSVNDVQNSVTITARRRPHASGRDSETHSASPVRKHA